MINKLQKLIEELEVRELKAKKAAVNIDKGSDNSRCLACGTHLAFNLCVGKLRKILKEETAKDLPGIDKKGRTFDEWAKDEFRRW